MGFLDGFKAVWSEPELRNKVIAYTLGATAVTCAATYVATKAITKKEREYLKQGRVVTIDGELYWKEPNGELRPYFENRRTDLVCNDRDEKYECNDAFEDDVIYIKGKPFVMDAYGNYVPVRIPSTPKRKHDKKHYG